MAEDLTFNQGQSKLGVGEGEVVVPDWFRQYFKASIGDPLFNVSDTKFPSWMIDTVARYGMPVPAGQIVGLRRDTVRNYATSQSAVTVANTTETDVLSEIIAPRTLGTSGGIRVVLTGQYTNNSGVPVNVTFKIKLGGSTLWTFLSNYTSVAAAHDVYLQFTLGNQTEATQFVGGVLLVGDPGGSPGSTTPLTGSGAVDTTVQTTLSVTVQHAAGGPPAPSFVRQYYTVELF